MMWCDECSSLKTAQSLYCFQRATRATIVSSNHLSSCIVLGLLAQCRAECHCHWPCDTVLSYQSVRVTCHVSLCWGSPVCLHYYLTYYLTWSTQSRLIARRRSVRVYRLFELRLPLSDTITNEKSTQRDANTARAANAGEVHPPYLFLIWSRFLSSFKSLKGVPKLGT